MNSVEIVSAISESWSGMEPVRVGRIPAGLPKPNLYANVTLRGRPFLRIDLYAYPEEQRCFQSATLWAEFAVVGFGERLYLINLGSRQKIEFSLESYFGQLLTNERFLLAASAERVFCFAPNGDLLWRSPMVGVDGVVLHEVNEHEIRGAGEWDPPGDWKDFILRTKSGELLRPDAQ